MTEHDHLDLELQDLLDERLSPVERARVQAHVDICPRCREHLDELRRGRDLARSSRPAPELPPGLLDDVVRQLDTVATRGHGLVIRRRSVLVYGLGAAAAALLAGLYVRRRPDLPAEVIETFKSYRAGGRPFEIDTTDPPTLEQFFGARLDFHTRVYDLGMMSYRLVGGRTDRLGSHPTALYGYTGPQNRRLQCQMYRGTLAELPPGDRRFNNGVTFFVYVRDAHTAIFWSEGDVVCVLVSDMPAEDTIALAFAKATKT